MYLSGMGPTGRTGLTGAGPYTGLGIVLEEMPPGPTRPTGTVPGPPKVYYRPHAVSPMNLTRPARISQALNPEPKGVLSTFMQVA